MKAYDESLKIMRDNKNVVDYAREMGLEQGLEQGREQERIALVRGMRTAGLTEEQIMRITGMTREQLAAL